MTLQCRRLQKATPVFSDNSVKAIPQNTGLRSSSLARSLPYSFHNDYTNVVADSFFDFGYPARHMSSLSVMEYTLE